MDGGQRPVEQRAPCRDRLLVHMVEPERQLQPDPEHARHYLDHLVRTGRRVTGVPQGFFRAFAAVGLGVHISHRGFLPTGLAGQGFRYQPENRVWGGADKMARSGGGCRPTDLISMSERKPSRRPAVR